MNLLLAPPKQEMLKAAEEWLEQWLPGDYDDRFDSYRLDVEFRLAYQQAAFDAGWLVPSHERELGGQSTGEEAEFWIKLSFARRPAPKLTNVAGPGVIAPALLRFGHANQRTYAKPVLRGDEIWCLGMSEPDAGSDLAALRTTAVRSDGSFVVNGQKIWTSNARDAKWCLLFARTDMELPRHQGISAFTVPMDKPNITVRPIDRIGAGDEEFCEVFFDHVEVDTSSLLGPLNEGWKVAMASLEHERDMIWMMNLAEIERALEIGGEIHERDDPILATERGRLRALADAIALTGMRGLANRLAGRPDTQVPLLKLASTEAAQRAFWYAAEAAGEQATLSGPTAPFHGGIAAGEIEALGATLYGGTSEIHRNIIGERLLGLPRENQAQ